MILCGDTPLQNAQFLAEKLRQAIESAISASETLHQAELRVVIEGRLPLHELLCRHSPRHRAIELFSHLRVWDTEHNSGVLIYILCADHAVEIVADRGIHQRVENGFWSAVCTRMQNQFREGKFEAGILQAITEITQALAKHFPEEGAQRSELPDTPLML